MGKEDTYISNNQNLTVTARAGETLVLAPHPGPAKFSQVVLEPVCPLSAPSLARAQENPLLASCHVIGTSTWYGIDPVEVERGWLLQFQLVLGTESV